jgi:hypothetical protein
MGGHLVIKHLRKRLDFVVVAHYPDHLSAEGCRIRGDAIGKRLIGIDFTAVCKITGEHQSVNVESRGHQTIEKGREITVGIDGAIELPAAREKVRVTDVNEYMICRRMLAKQSHWDTVALFQGPRIIVTTDVVGNNTCTSEGSLKTMAAASRTSRKHPALCSSSQRPGTTPRPRPRAEA